MTSEMEKTWSNNSSSVDHHSNDFTTCFSQTAIDRLCR